MLNQLTNVKNRTELDVVMQTCNPSIQGVKAGGS
jgi:hypothetical protein